MSRAAEAALPPSAGTRVSPASGHRGRRARRAPALILGAVLVLAGCGRSVETEDHAAHHHGDGDGHEEGGSPAQFRPGHGLRLAAETAAAIGLTTAVVEERVVTGTHEIRASVFQAGPPARASALVPAGLADELVQHPSSEAKVLAVDRALARPLAKVELTLELPGAVAAGETVTLTWRGPTRTGTAVPRSALLHTAAGTVVYVVDGDYLRRTPVRTGASGRDHAEILDGLQAGDVVATNAVEQLWLTELRLTRGGGHSH